MTAMASYPPASKQALPTLTVMAGLHRGVSLELDEPFCSLGSGASASLVLGDPGIADEHLRLRFAGRQLVIEATGGDVTVNDAGHETVVEHGRGYRARFPVEIALGQARVRLADPACVVSAKPPVWYGKPQWLVAAAFMLICAGAVAMLQERPASVSLSQQSSVEAVPVEAQPEPSITDIRAELERLAAESGLDSVAFSIRDRQLFASGRYAPEQAADWVALQRHFDSHYASRLLLHRNVTAETVKTRPQVALKAIWFGNDPYVIDASGERLVPGAAMKDGWVIERIESDQVLLARGERRFAFTLGEAAPAAAPKDPSASEG